MNKEIRNQRPRWTRCRGVLWVWPVWFLTTQTMGEWHGTPDAGSPGSGPPENAREVQATPPKAPKPGREGSSPTRKNIRRLLKQLRQLQTAMSQQLDLTNAQQDTVNELFSNYLKSLRKGRPRDQGLDQRVESVNEMNRLREEMKSAGRAGDLEKARKLRQELRRAMRKGVSTSLPTTSRFLSILSKELQPDQRKRFRDMIHRFRITSSLPRRGGLRLLWRAVMQPSVGLTESQRDKVAALLREGLDESATARREGHVEAMDEITQRVRHAVLEALSPQQRDAVTAAMSDRSRVRKNGEGRGGTRTRRKDRNATTDPSEAPSPVGRRTKDSDPPPP